MKILFTVAYLDGYHGSMLHVREIGKYLVEKSNDEVIVGCIFYTETIKNTFAELGIQVFDLNQIDINICYDVVFSYHFPAIESLLNDGLQCKKLVLGSLSGMELLETFPIFWENASMLLTMSERTKEKHCKFYGIDSDKIDVMENCIPDCFAEYTLQRSLPKDQPNTVMVVSNHVPKELMDIQTFLTSRGIQIDYWGTGQEHYGEITPEIIADYDVVISIGKTVQYAMGMGIPVFEYDYFGGNGYIYPDTMDREAYDNFVGLPANRKLTSEELVTELLAHYSEARQQVQLLKRKALDRFLLSSSVNRIMKKISVSEDFKPDFSGVKYNAKLDLVHGKSYCQWTGNLKCDSFIKADQILQLQRENEHLKEQIDLIVNTKGYKMIERLRKIKRLI